MHYEKKYGESLIISILKSPFSGSGGRTSIKLTYRSVMILSTSASSLAVLVFVGLKNGIFAVLDAFFPLALVRLSESSASATSSSSASSLDSSTCSPTSPLTLLYNGDFEMAERVDLFLKTSIGTL